MIGLIGNSPGQTCHNTTTEYVLEFRVMAELCQCQFSSHGHTRNTETCSPPSSYCLPSASLPRCWDTPTNWTAHTRESRTGRAQASSPEPSYFLCRGWWPIFRYVYISNISHIKYIMIWWHIGNMRINIMMRNLKATARQLESDWVLGSVTATSGLVTSEIVILSLWLVGRLAFCS